MVLRLAGALNVFTFEQCDEVLQNALADGAERIVVDLSELDSISSAGAGALLGATEAVQDKGGELVVCALRPAVRETLAMLGLIGAAGKPASLKVEADLATARKRLLEFYS